MTVKSVIAEVKALGDGGKAEFEAYASVFGNRDSYGDVVQKGAFAASLKAWAEKGAPIPLLWGHNMADPDFNIGMVTSAEEDEHGLKVVCELDTDSPKGAQVHRLLKQGRVREMSFAFAATSSEYGELDGKSVRFLKEVDLFEVSVVPLGANPETEVLAVKSPTVNLTLPETLAERFLEVLGGKSLGGPPGTDEEDDDEDTPDSEDESSDEGVSSSEVTDSGGEDEPGEDAGESDEDDEDEEGRKADLDRFETMFRAVGRD
ncbi:HK97 family phage prohead protease [Corynebacterium striatum]|uniref:HK97 family phage prohead protease n=1 Tax=Corynebacterium striatum TaxID=43770 RepID=A0ABC8CM19_CORST|nr:HK97 family phage prohead protease [Corynebacterium striatum]ATZ08315.1 HK97 family phage prohead protease [Corynebacterium striatum]EGT5592390.1 HK97 family phage prohead protease [Corynebacterium striatum]EGT5613274.1 HK97 family phage prohead protease [Corynebacterium striatum]